MVTSCCAFKVMLPSASTVASPSWSRVILVRPVSTVTRPPLDWLWSMNSSDGPAVARTVPSVMRTVILGGISMITSRGGLSVG